jgi:hypothetical protein
MDGSREIESLIERLSTDLEYHKNVDAQFDDMKLIIKVCSDCFRHNYSEIYHKLLEVFDKEQLDVISILPENLKILEEKIIKEQTKNPDDERLLTATKSFASLCDHIALEIHRYSFLQKKIMMVNPNQISLAENQLPLNHKYIKRIEELEKKNDSYESILLASGLVAEKASVAAASASTKAETASLKAETAQGEIEEKIRQGNLTAITSLSVFSAVILAITGGITFASGVFNGINSATPYRLVFIVSLIGFVLFNLIFLLLYIVAKIIGKSIEMECRFWNHKDENSTKRCGEGVCSKNYTNNVGFCRLFNRHVYVSIVNIILLSLMYYSVIYWYFEREKLFINVILFFSFFAVPIFVIFTGYLASKFIIFLQLRRNRVYLLNSAIERYLKYSTSKKSKIEVEIDNYFASLLNESSISSEKEFKHLFARCSYYVDDFTHIEGMAWPYITLAQHNRNKYKLLQNKKALSIELFEFS